MVRAFGICLDGPGFNSQSGRLFSLTRLTQTYTFAAITLADTNSTVEVELYDSGVSHHMLPH